MPDNPFLIARRQIRSLELSGYMVDVLNNSFTGLISSYSLNNGYYGQGVVYATGMTQTINGQKTFALNPGVPYSGETGTCPSRLYIDTSGLYLQLQLNTLQNPVFISGTQLVSGEKQFYKILINSGRFTGVCEVPYPANNSGAISKEYLTNTLNGLNTNTVFTSGEQNISGNKIFYGASVYIPTATHNSGAVPLSQLGTSGMSILSAISETGNDLQTQIDYLQAQIDVIDISSAGSLTGFAGVAAINGQSGFIFTQGRGNVTTTQNGNILNISGNTLQGYTGAFLGYVNVISGSDRQFIQYSQTYSVTPYVFTQLESPSGNPILNYYVSGRVTSGFSVVFSNTVGYSGYGLSYIGWTGTGSVVNIVQGPQGTNGLSLTGTNLYLNYYTNSLATNTGSGVYESFVSKTTYLTGWNIGMTNTGSGSIAFTGFIYKRDTANTQTNLIGFTLPTGAAFTGVYLNPVITVAPYSRIGLDILNMASGSNKLTFSIFGYQ